MKKIIKLLSIIYILIGAFLGLKVVNAKTLTLNYAPFYYERRTLTGEVNSWMMPKYTIDGITSYCVDFEVGQGVNYQIADWKDMNLSEENKDKILLTAYYGYDYPNHQNDYYLAATQALLWQLTSNKGVSVTFNTARFSKGSNVDVSAYINEINNLVAHHYDKPNLKSNYQINLKEELILEDNLFNNYEIVSSDSLDVKIINNKLIIKGNKKGDYNVRLVKKQVYNGNYYFLSSPGYQNMLIAGNLEPFYIDFKVSVLSGNITVNKKDLNTNKNILKNGIKFKLRDEFGNDVCSDTCIYETNSNGTLNITNIPYSKYYLYELSDKIDGYLWNSEELPITLNSSNVEVDFYNQPVVGQIKIIKYGEEMIIDNDLVYYENIFLSDVKFVLKAREDIVYNNEIIYRSEDIVKEVISNNGIIEINDLYLGKYYLYEEYTTLNHLIDNRIYEFELSYQDQFTPIISIEKELYNYLPKGSISIIKEDNDNNRLANVLFGLYKDDKLLLKCRTDINGECVFDNLVYDNYQVMELQGLDGYLFNDEVVDVKLDQDLIFINIINEKEPVITIEFDIPTDEEIVEIDIPDTNSNDLDLILILLIIFNSIWSYY